MTTEHPITIAGRAACEALTRALDTESRAADEIEARGGQRTARSMLDTDRSNARAALWDFALKLRDPHMREALEMSAGVIVGCAREKWTLRIMAIATEAVAEEKTT